MKGVYIKTDMSTSPQEMFSDPLCTKYFRYRFHVSISFLLTSLHTPSAAAAIPDQGNHFLLCAEKGIHVWDIKCDSTVWENIQMHLGLWSGVHNKPDNKTIATNSFPYIAISLQTYLLLWKLYHTYPFFTIHSPVDWFLILQIKWA